MSVCQVTQRRIEDSERGPLMAGIVFGRHREAGGAED